jgi:hypothetical protein
VIRRFPDRGSFVSWLAAQSDVTMSEAEADAGAPGARITRHMLRSTLDRKK